MKDNGIVVSTKEDMAKVEVDCFVESCQNCRARSLCIGQNQSRGLIVVKNSLHATPGDKVEIEIPETRYNKVLILLFGSLLTAALLGLAAGYFSSSLLPLSPSQSSLLGLLLGIILAGWGLFRFFRKKNDQDLYPVVIDIIKKGDKHG